MSYAIQYAMRRDNLDCQRRARQTLQAAGPGRLLTRAGADHRQTLQCRPHLGGGLAGHSGNAPSAVGPRHAGVDPEGAEDPRQEVPD